MFYPAKVLLFGEYTILNGSHALAIPYVKYSGSFALGAEEDLEIESQQSLTGFLEWFATQQIAGLFIDLEKIKTAISDKIWFDSSIPLGSGLGSSGALVAAVATEFSNLKTNFSLEEQWRILAKMESYFHGSSSGIDPLVSFIQKPIRIKNGKIEILDNLELGTLPFELIPSKNQVSTSDLVAMYKVKLKNETYKKAIEQNLIPIVNKLVDAYPSQESNALLMQLSELQTELFPEMLGKNGLSLALDGQLNSQFSVKLCGSGGGFLLKFHHASIH